MKDKDQTPQGTAAAQSIMDFFPYDIHPVPTLNQRIALGSIERDGGSSLLELPTGTGKSDVAFTFLSWAQAKLGGTGVLATKNKTLVAQAKQMFPGMAVAYGRGEHPCLYFPDKPRANQIPCSMLVDCPHRVNLTTGETHEPGAERCPYLQQKYQASNSPLVVCTTAFYLYSVLFSQSFPKPSVVVFDEVHTLADTLRSVMSFQITDYALKRAIEALRAIGALVPAGQLQRFLDVMLEVVKSKKAKSKVLLEQEEILRLVEHLKLINQADLRKQVQASLKDDLDEEKREAFKQVEDVVFNLQRYINSLGYSLETYEHMPLNYAYAFHKEEREKNERVQHRVVVNAYFVVPLIRKMTASYTLGLSATIGDPDIFKFETGLDLPFHSLASGFSNDKARVYMPTNTADLSVKKRKKGEPNKTLRQIITACKDLRQAGHRSLVVLGSNLELSKFLQFSKEVQLDAISYGNGVPPREAAQKFKDGAGDVLVGTPANYGEGLDLPDQIAPVIFMLRPGYASPNEPQAQFEMQRYPKSRVWAIWRYRVMQQALQVRGRNIRSAGDSGVTVFISQQFRTIVYHALPKWLKDAYRDDVAFQEVIAETKTFLAHA